MITRFGLAPRLPGLTLAEFRRHWREQHAAPSSGGGIRLLTFFSAASDLDALATVLATPGRGVGAAAVEAFVRLREVVGAFDGVEALWFADAATAREHLTSEAAERDRCALAGLVRGTERVLATVHVVR